MISKLLFKSRGSSIEDPLFLYHLKFEYSSFKKNEVSSQRKKNQKMIKFVRHIKVGDQEFETWFGMEIKKKGNRPNIDIFYYTDDPSEELSMHQLIKSNFQSKKDALQFGIKFMRSMYQDMIQREKEVTKKEKKAEQSDSTEKVSE